MEKPYVVGIDIGGTNTVFGVVDARGTVLYSGSIKTGKYAEIEEYVTALGQGLTQIIDQVVLRRSKVLVWVHRTATTSTVALNLLPTCPGKVKFLWLS